MNTRNQYFQGIPDDDPYLRILWQILNQQETFGGKLDELEDRLTAHMRTEKEAAKSWLNSLPTKPDGTPDVEGHRDYHQALIEEARDRAKMWRELRVELIKKGAWGVVVVIGALVAYWWNHEVKK